MKSKVYSKKRNQAKYIPPSRLGESHPYDKQIGGTHYKDMKIQPSEFINRNKLLFAEGNAIKYICRHTTKGEVKDLEKAKHYIDMIIERDYEDTEV